MLVITMMFCLITVCSNIVAAEQNLPQKLQSAPQCESNNHESELHLPEVWLSPAPLCSLDDLALYYLALNEKPKDENNQQESGIWVVVTDVDWENRADEQ